MERILLLVDDEENILLSLTRVFRKDGYRILMAGTGAEGLALLSEHDIGVIVSDHRMPEMTGTEFLCQVKQKYPNSVRIMLSGYTDLKSVTDAINEGATYKFLTKPWDDDLLRASVREAFEYHELRRENQRLENELRQANSELSSMNSELERHVADKVRELTINLRSLHVSQEIVEFLPVGVLGIGDDGLIVLANDYAESILNLKGGTLIGCEIDEVIPLDLLNYHRVAVANPNTANQGFTLSKGQNVHVYCRRLGLNNMCSGSMMALIPIGISQPGVEFLL